MTMKEKVIEVLRGNKLTIKEITEKINKKYPNITTEARIRTYIWRLKDEKKDNAIEECGKDNLYKLYKLKSESSNEKNQLLDTQILKKLLSKFIELEINLKNTNEKEDKRIMELIKECQLI